MDSSSDDMFDAIVFRDTAGAPKSFSAASFNSINQFHSAQRDLPEKNINVLKPKVTVKIIVHEEVSSTQERENEMEEIISHVHLDGTVNAQVSTPALSNNPPFSIQISDPDHVEDSGLRFDTKFMTFYGDGEFNTVSVPKSVRNPFKIASYNRSCTRRSMPILATSKVIWANKESRLCKLMLQIRSNLSNKGRLYDMVVAMAVPPTVLGKTLQVKIGNGIYDALKRVVRWRVEELKPGACVELEAEVRLASNVYELPRIPILLRCSSNEDSVSSLGFDVKGLSGHPVLIEVIMQRSFNLLHRLPL